MDKIRITGIKKGSIAEEIGIQIGDYLLQMNGENVIDILDYKFNEAEEELEVMIEHADGEREIYEIEKDDFEELGLEFESELIDKPHSCRNKCIFCFMEQLPPHVRNTLIFKDDDYRLSFFTGNYITMTNMKEEDIDRIIRYRISPINISIHATDEQVRCKMLQNRFAGKVLRYLDRLHEANIAMNTQIVLCKGINDGKVLEKTILELSHYAENMKSICIVPVGLSKFRVGKFPLEPLDKEDAIQTIRMVETFQKQFQKQYHTRMVYLADEFYFKAGIKIPNYSHYEEFSQLENGVGMIALFEHEWQKAIKKLEKRLESIKNKIERHITIITGKITQEWMTTKMEELETLLPHIKITVMGIENEYFGTNITVTGLVTGQDIIRELLQKKQAGESLGAYIILPNVLLKEDEAIFLDDETLVGLEQTLKTKIIVADPSPEVLIQAITATIPTQAITYMQDSNSISNSYENSKNY